MNKVLIIVGDATETVDTLYPYYRLIEGGYEPVIAAPEKRLYQMVLHEVKPVGPSPKSGKGTRFKQISPSRISIQMSISVSFSAVAVLRNIFATMKI